ncbi:hypothetical protein bcgnr5378_07280 [Bacillus cereus]|uniref:Putative lipoprotein n=1 Tax=Bacillus cereus TaxID=1396 RepID=A0A164NXX9_BACCE|nr:hypothetical protein [Bacillus cereus]KZD65980.1 putative lipoprotein [Bacillus cereus]
MNLKLICISLLSVILAGCSINNAEGVTYTNNVILIPDGYEGELTALYNVPGAKPLQQEGNFSVLNFDEDGVALTSTKDFVTGRVNDQYYYVDSLGNRTEINRDCIRIISTGSVLLPQVKVHDEPFNQMVLEVTKSKCSKKFLANGSGEVNSSSTESRTEILLKKLKEINL